MFVDVEVSMQLGSCIWTLQWFCQLLSTSQNITITSYSRTFTVCFHNLLFHCDGQFKKQLKWVIVPQFAKLETFGAFYLQGSKTGKRNAKKFINDRIYLLPNNCINLISVLGKWKRSSRHLTASSMT